MMKFVLLKFVLYVGPTSVVYKLVIAVVDNHC